MNSHPIALHPFPCPTASQCLQHINHWLLNVNMVNTLPHLVNIIILLRRGHINIPIYYLCYANEGTGADRG